MARLEELKRGVTVKGIPPDGFITVVDVSWIGSVAIELTHKDSKGKLANELIYRDREGDLEILESGKPWGLSTTPALQAKETKHVEMIAMKAVMEAERELGFVPRDVSADKCGYDVESRDPDGNARLRFVEVKGRALGADTVTITKNEILTALNKPEQFILAVVEVDGEEAAKITYMRKPFGREPDFGVTSVNYKLTDLLAKGEQPR